MPKRVLGLLLTALGLSGCQLIRDQLDGNQGPVVDHFMPDLSLGWEVSDIKDDKLSCTLAYEDGEKQKVENCGEVTHTFHAFEEPGGYTVALQVHDGMNRAARSGAVRVLEGEMVGSGSLESRERLPQGGPLQKYMTGDSTRANKRVLQQ